MQPTMLPLGYAATTVRGDARKDLMEDAKIFGLTFEVYVENGR